MIRVSTPGKLMLFGEHAVVYNRPCIVTAIDRRANVRIKESNETVLNAPDIGIEEMVIHDYTSKNYHPRMRLVITCIKNFFETYDITANVEINIDTSTLTNLGLGTSSGVVVSLIKGLDELFETNLTEKQLFDLGYKTILDVHEIGSGFDIAVAIYGGTLYFVTAGKKINRLKVKELPIIVGYTGVKANTHAIVKGLKKRYEKNYSNFDEIFNSIRNVVERAKIELEKNNLKELGKLMNMNQDLLKRLGVSTPKLSRLIEASIIGGAYGAKLSGAGGGDCMMALVNKNTAENVENEIVKAGGKIIPLTTNAEGVRLE